jgi:hypothetical protein
VLVASGQVAPPGLLERRLHLRHEFLISLRVMNLNIEDHIRRHRASDVRSSVIVALSHRDGTPPAS